MFQSRKQTFLLQQLKVRESLKLGVCVKVWINFALFTKDNFYDVLIGIVLDRIYDQSLRCISFMLYFTPESFFQILWYFWNCWIGAGILSTESIAFLTP